MKNLKLKIKKALHKMLESNKSDISDISGIQNIFSISEYQEVLTEEEIESLKNEIKKLED